MEKIVLNMGNRFEAGKLCSLSKYHVRTKLPLMVLPDFALQPAENTMKNPLMMQITSSTLSV